MFQVARIPVTPLGVRPSCYLAKSVSFAQQQSWLPIFLLLLLFSLISIERGGKTCVLWCQSIQSFELSILRATHSLNMVAETDIRQINTVCILCKTAIEKLRNWGRSCFVYCSLLWEWKHPLRAQWHLQVEGRDALLAVERWAESAQWLPNYSLDLRSMSFPGWGGLVIEHLLSGASFQWAVTLPGAELASSPLVTVILLWKKGKP